MAKQTIQDIEEQIKKLQDKKKELIDKRNSDIGEYLIKTWKLENKSSDEIFKLIDTNNPNSELTKI